MLCAFEKLTQPRNNNSNVMNFKTLSKHEFNTFLNSTIKKNHLLATSQYSTLVLTLLLA